MSKVNKTGRSKGHDPHTRLYRWERNCDAYRSLSVYSKCLLDELKNRYSGENNGDIHLSTREGAELLDCSKNTITKSLRELEERGFIRPKRKGSFNLKTKDATTWILTREPYRNEPATKDFMRWRRPHAAPNMAPLGAAQGSELGSENLEVGPTTWDARSHHVGQVVTTWDRETRDSPPTWDRQAENQGSTVPRGGTLIVYQGDSLEQDAPEEPVLVVRASR